MLMCMLVTAPMMISFANLEALDGQAGYFINRFSLGNLGGSMTQCSNVAYTEQGARFNLLCNSGVINVNAIDNKTGKGLFQAGIINKG